MFNQITMLYVYATFLSITFWNLMQLKLVKVNFITEIYLQVYTPPVLMKATYSKRQTRMCMQFVSILNITAIILELNKILQNLLRCFITSLMWQIMNTFIMFCCFWFFGFLFYWGVGGTSIFQICDTRKFLCKSLVK